MWNNFFLLMKKDFKLMLSSKFFLLTLGSLIIYSGYINLVYAKIDQEIFPIYIYDPANIYNSLSEAIPIIDKEQFYEACADGYSVGLDCSNSLPQVYMVSSGTTSIDNLRLAYAISTLSEEESTVSAIIGENNLEMKNRREITAEFLFFELSAVGFLGLAAMLYKEKQMGVIRVHSILPISKCSFIFSKLLLIVLFDLIFTTLLTLINLGFDASLKVLPLVLFQATILSTIMALVGFLCAIILPDFKQFSLFYLILAIFITTPVFLAGQTGLSWAWINYHPMYHLFMAMKNSYFQTPTINIVYYFSCVAIIILLFIVVHWGLNREMSKEG